MPTDTHFLASPHIPHTHTPPSSSCFPVQSAPLVCVAHSTTAQHPSHLSEGATREVRDAVDGSRCHAHQFSTLRALWCPSRPVCSGCRYFGGGRGAKERAVRICDYYLVLWVVKTYNIGLREVFLFRASFPCSGYNSCFIHLTAQPPNAAEGQQKGRGGGRDAGASV